MKNKNGINPKFSGESLDPTFVPQVQIQPNHDFTHALETVIAMQHPIRTESINNIPASQEIDEESPANPMSEDDLKSLIRNKIESSHGWFGSGKLASQRIDADKYYRGEPIGNEQEGCSQVVSRDVAEVIESALPSLMRIFASGDQVCEFTPNSPEDENIAEQATDYINHIFMNENEGFMILLTWFKDALLKKNGIVKVWHDVRMKRTKDNYQGLTAEQLQALQMNNSIKVTQIQPYQDQIITIDPMSGQPIAQPVTFYNCLITSTKPEKRIRIMNVPPDEFIIERRAVSIETATFLAHRGKRTISDLLECGYDPDKINAIPTGDEKDYSGERMERFRDENINLYDNQNSALDPSTRKVWVTEAYLMCDYDGDGIAEWRKVTIAGDTARGSTILDNVEVDDHAFADLTPIPEPHKFYGQSLFDQTKDLQDIKTALIRGILDSTYLANSPRLGAVEGKVNMDDLLDSRPGGIVRLKSADGLIPIPNMLVSDSAMSVISYIDQVKEKRTGISTMSAGLNPNILNSSATGADILNNNNQQRLEMICRIFAETGVKRLFRLIFQLVCQYQDVARTVRLRNKWVTVDPQSWKDRMDLSVSVGMGLGSKQQQAAMAMQMLNLDKQIVQMQGGIEGPFITPNNIYNKLVKLVEAVGWKTPDAYYTNPKDWQPPQPQPPTPEQQVKMTEAQAKMMQAQADVTKAQTDTLSNLEIKKLDFEMKKLDTLIKQIELEALQFQSIEKVAQKADNKVNNDTMPGFMQHG